ncbi:acyl-CoA thioesterase [Flavobacterium sp. ZT3R18]|nr:acyl-CoA thioesterase [Flavobacterium sp. ZT3R18]
MNKNPNSKYKIRFTDCDMFGHLNNSRYLDYLINAREDHLKDFYDFDFNEYYKNNLAWVIGSHEIAYLRPAFSNEIVTIQSTLLNLDIESLHLEIIMMNEEQNKIKAIMRSRLIPINIKTGRKEQHKPDFMEWAKNIENIEIDKQLNLQQRIKQLTAEYKTKESV